MGYIKPENIDQMHDLLDGKSLTSGVRTSLCYGVLKNQDKEDFWTLLLYTGYLTFNPKYISKKRNEYELYVPNREVRDCFEEKISVFIKKYQYPKLHHRFNQRII